jgi:hypothetical protein
MTDLNLTVVNLRKGAALSEGVLAFDYFTSPEASRAAERSNGRES